jgi:hypothetical protein
MRAVCKIRELTLLLRVGTSWKCGVGIFFEICPLASDALLTTLHPLLENVLQTVDHFEISSLWAPFSWLEKPRNRMGRDLNWILCSAWKTWIGGIPLEHTPYSQDLARWEFWAFPTMKRELRGKKFRNNLWSAARFRDCVCVCVCVWSVVRSASLAKEGTSKKRPSLHLHKVRTRVIRWDHELCKRPSYISMQNNSSYCLCLAIEVEFLHSFFMYLVRHSYILWERIVWEPWLELRLQKVMFILVIELTA